jgi:hypothetical protein
MTRFVALCGLALVLGLVLAWEINRPLLSPDDGEPVGNAWQPPASRATVETGTGFPQGAIDAAEMAELKATITGRPLFSRLRRFSDGHIGAGIAAPPGDVPPRLSGVLVGPEGEQAIFADASGKPITVRVGDRLGAFTVQTIRPGAVTLSGAGADREIHPAYLGTSGAGNTTTTIVRGAATPPGIAMSPNVRPADQEGRP